MGSDSEELSSHSMVRHKDGLLGSPSPIEKARQVRLTITLPIQAMNPPNT